MPILSPAAPPLYRHEYCSPDHPYRSELVLTAAYTGVIVLELLRHLFALRASDIAPEELAIPDKEDIEDEDDSNLSVT
jgi:hypothetical protein